jgi:hypothetical protein
MYASMQVAEFIVTPFSGYVYPNETVLPWGVLIVVYPYITGLVAGAFILASLERVFKVDAVRPTYRLALLTALAFLLVAPLPLQLHLGHPERSLEMYLTPHTSSAMAMFGFAARNLARLSRRNRQSGVNHQGTAALDLPLADARFIQRQPGGAPHRREGGLCGDRNRHSFGISTTRIRGLYLRIGEGQSLVVDTPDARGVSFFGDGFGNRRRDGAVRRLQ